VRFLQPGGNSRRRFVLALKPTLIDSPNERILVLYRSGHLGWLRQDIANDASVRLRKFADLTGRQ
jgi:hypothetical protein